MFGDDGEKFGAWPETKKHVYEDGWLARFFDLLVGESRAGFNVTHAGEVLDNVPPVGKVYLPEGSYREMTEWVLPADQLAEYVHVRRELEHDPRWPRIARFVRGGFWRNFKVKYPETDEMYARMMMVSRRLQDPGRRRRQGELDRSVPARHCIAASAIAATGTGRSAASICRTCATPSTSQLIAADNLLDRAERPHASRGSKPRPTISISTAARKSSWPTTA